MEERSIMAMADDILGGALSNSAEVPVLEDIPDASQEEELAEIPDEIRDSFINESMEYVESLGRELKPHASQTTRSFTPSGKGDKHTDVSVSSDDRAKLSPGAKQKLKSHDQRSGSRDDARTSWAVDMPQGGQKAKWQAERERQAKHKASQGVKTKGAQQKPATSTDPWQAGQTHSKSSPDSIQGRKAKLTPANKEKMAQKAPAHQARRRADAEQKRKDDHERWRRTNPAMKRVRNQRAKELRDTRRKSLQNSSVTKSDKVMTLCDGSGGVKRLTRKQGAMDRDTNKAIDKSYDWHKPGESSSDQTARLSKARDTADALQKKRVANAARLGRKTAEGEGRPLQRAVRGESKMTQVESKKPSAGLSKKKKKAVAKKASAGKDIGKKGKNFDKVADKAAAEYGSKEAGEKVAAAAMWKNMKKEHVETLIKARDILREMTSVGGIGVGQMAGSANKAYDVDARPMGKDVPPIKGVDKSMRKISKSTAKKKLAKKSKKKAVKQEAFQRMLDSVLSNVQQD